MSGFWEAPDDYAESVDSGHGSAHSVSSDHGKTKGEKRAEAVRRVAEEVGRKPIPRPSPRRMGFL